MPEYFKETQELHLTIKTKTKGMQVVNYVRCIKNTTGMYKNYYNKGRCRYQGSLLDIQDERVLYRLRQRV